MQCVCQKSWSRDLGLLALRLALGSVFIYHGFGKLSDIAMTTGFFDMVGIPLPGLFAWVVALVELIGGIAIILGVYVKTVALITAFTMLVALLLVHLGQPWSGAELAVLSLGGSLGLAASGAGTWRLLKGSECLCPSSKNCDQCSKGEMHAH